MLQSCQLEEGRSYKLELFDRCRLKFVLVELRMHLSADMVCLVRFHYSGGS